MLCMSSIARVRSSQHGALVYVRLNSLSGFLSEPEMDEDPLVYQLNIDGF